MNGLLTQTMAIVAAVVFFLFSLFFRFLGVDADFFEFFYSRLHVLTYHLTVAFVLFDQSGYLVFVDEGSQPTWPGSFHEELHFLAIIFRIVHPLTDGGIFDFLLVL